MLKKTLQKKISSRSDIKKQTAKKPVVLKKAVKKGKALLRPTSLSRKKKSVQLGKSEHNPILSPIGEHHWESGQTFNPAAVFLDGIVHLVYRSIGGDGVSRFGYAASYDADH